MGKWKWATGYTRQGKLFENWNDIPERFCSVCGRGYITTVKTPRSIIFVHASQILCQEFDDEIRT